MKRAMPILIGIVAFLIGWFAHQAAMEMPPSEPPPPETVAEDSPPDPPTVDPSYPNLPEGGINDLRR